jgi:hypothetical protein
MRSEEQEIARLRAEVIGDRVPLSVWAKVRGVSERQAYNLVNKHALSYVVVDGTRYLDLHEDLRHGALRQHKPLPPSPEPRRRGRPPKLMPEAPRRVQR